ncbi:hypothetical protein [Ekhidna sp.]|uniref:hypothetical protein n=1 Tax=Ekhidna sp. TaxID=2608089 RepID=UPI003B509CB2
MQRILILIVFVYAGALRAQIKSQVFVDSTLYSEVQFPDSLALSSYVKNLQLNWIDQGHYFSGVDSVLVTNDWHKIYLHKGNKFNASIQNVKGRKLHSQLKRELKNYTNNGYPFASLEIDSLNLTEDLLTGRLLIASGPEITYDSAFFFNPLKTNHSYIYQSLDITPGDSFSEKSYRGINKKIKRSSFLSLKSSPDLSFHRGKAKLYLDIEEKASNTFHGVIGLQQSGAGNTSFVGNLNLDIQNLFRSGKKFKFAWERFSEASQELDVRYKHPFIFGSKISPSGRLIILKQDTTFLTRTAGIGLNTYIAPGVELSFEVEQTDGTLLSTDIKVIGQSGLADYRRTAYQVAFFNGDRSSLETYSQGFIWSLSAAAGRKTIERNVSIPDNYYDTIQSNTDFYRFENHAAYQLKVLKRQTVFHSIKGGLLSNKELLKNELYRIGGLTTLRGFNEKSIFAESYFLSRLELRSFFEDSSYAFLFYDQLLFNRTSFSDNPLGLGLGFTLGSSSGQFTFAFAIGKSKAQPITFSNMKAHFGYITRF